jgi:phosphatidylglycerophosphate synthase
MTISSVPSRSLPPAAEPRRRTLSELRAIAQPPQYSPSVTDRFYRAFSIFLSIPLARLGATPNGITLGWTVLGLAAAACLLSPSWAVRLAGGLALELSYLLDYVDGEVARLTGRKSTTGEFIDLIGHGLIKISLPLAVGGAAAAMTGDSRYLVVGGLGAVAIGVGDSLRFYAACASGDLAGGDLGHVVHVRHGPRRITAVKIIVTAYEQSFESPGLYGLALLAAATGLFAPLALYWAVVGAAWLTLRARRYCRRMSLAAPVPSATTVEPREAEPVRLAPSRSERPELRRAG